MLTGGELYAYPKASEWLINDAFFNVEAWLAEEVGESFAELLGDAVIRGNASNKPTGMLNNAPSSRDDFDSPIRDVDEYKYLNADDNSPYAIGGDGLISLVYKVKSQYRAGASWAMNSNTAAVVRKLKTVDGQYLWQVGFAGGQPELAVGLSRRHLGTDGRHRRERRQQSQLSDRVRQFPSRVHVGRSH